VAGLLLNLMQLLGLLTSLMSDLFMNLIKWLGLLASLLSLFLILLE
jgi:hypothetical protein